jgi:hypothetical protein
MKLLGHNHKSEEWRLSTDASKVSPKGVLRITEIEFPSEPDFHAAQMITTKREHKTPPHLRVYTT